MCSMNQLDRKARAQILGMMVEGVSMESITRMTGTSKNTVAKYPSKYKYDETATVKLSPGDRSIATVAVRDLLP